MSMKKDLTGKDIQLVKADPVPEHPLEHFTIDQLMSGMLDLITGLQINNNVPDSHKVKDYTAEKLLNELQNHWVFMQFRLAEKENGEKEEKDSGQ